MSDATLSDPGAVLNGAGRDRGFLLGVLGATLVGACLRFWHLDLHGLWLDELFTTRVVSRESWSGLVEELSEDVHPPLYYVLMRLWISVVGASDVAFRWPSALAGVVGISGAAMLGRHLFGRRAGMAAGWMLAVLPFAVALDREARGNALMLCLGLWASAILAGHLRGHPSRRVLCCYLGCSVALVHTHVFGIFVLLAHGTWLGLETLDRPVSSLRNWLGVIAVSLASLLPWIPWFWGQARQFTADPWYMEPSPDSLGHLWMELSVGHAGLACMLLVGVVLVLVRASVNEDTSVRSGILFTVSVTVGLVLVPQVLSYGIAPILRPRNVVVWLGCMAVVSGAGWASLQPRVLAASCLGLVLGLQGLAAWRVVFFGEAREQWREIAAVVRSSHVQGERLFANHHQLWAHYLPDLNVESDEQSLPEVGGPYWVLAGHDTNTVAVRATVMLSAQLRDTHLTGARSLWVSPVAWRLPLEKLARKSGVWVGDRVAWYRDGVLRTSPRLLEGRCLIGASGRGDAAAGEPAKLALRVLQDGEVLHADQVELSGERTTIEGAHFDAPASPVEIELAFVNDVFVQSEGESEDRNAYLFQAWVRCE